MLTHTGITKIFQAAVKCHRGFEIGLSFCWTLLLYRTEGIVWHFCVFWSVCCTYIRQQQPCNMIHCLEPCLANGASTIIPWQSTAEKIIAKRCWVIISQSCTRQIYINSNAGLDNNVLENRANIGESPNLNHMDTTSNTIDCISTNRVWLLQRGATNLWTT